jgi:hypothetical protein
MHFYLNILTKGMIVNEFEGMRDDISAKNGFLT